MEFVFGADAGLVPCLLMALAAAAIGLAVLLRPRAQKVPGWRGGLIRNLHVGSWLLVAIGNSIRTGLTPIPSSYGVAITVLGFLLLCLVFMIYHWAVKLADEGAPAPGGWWWLG